MLIATILFAWSLFGKAEEPKSNTVAAAVAPAPIVVTNVIEKAAPAVDTEKLVESAVDKALKNLTDKMAKDMADRQAALDKALDAKADKAAAEEKAAAEKRRQEEKVAAEKAAAQAREDAKTAKAERTELSKQIDSRVFHLHHAAAQDVVTNLNTMWNGDFGQVWKVKQMAVAFPESNSILVTAPRLILDACEKAIAELDVEPQQVYVEARFVELGNKASHNVGIDWSMLDGMTGSASLGGGIQQYRVGSGVTDYTKRSDVSSTAKESYSVSGGKGTDASIRYFSGTLNFSQMALTLRCLDATEDARTFSNPKIIVSSGKKAIVDMTHKYPNVKISTKRTTGTSDSVDIAASLEAIPGEDKFLFAKEAFFSWGISLEVTPRIGTNGLINVSIVPTISDQVDWVNTGTTSSDESGTVSAKYPVIKVQRLISEFNMLSGTTAVIGGLSITTEDQEDNGIPLLKDIPGIGPRLFGSMQRVKNQKEIIVFVTVGLVDPHNIQKDAGLPKNAVMGRQYTEDIRREPGDRRHIRPEGIQSLDLRSLEEQYADPRRTNRVKRVTWEGLEPFAKDPDYKRSGSK